MGNERIMTSSGRRAGRLMCRLRHERGYAIADLLERQILQSWAAVASVFCRIAVDRLTRPGKKTSMGDPELGSE